jgi:hypothetical protein
MSVEILLRCLHLLFDVVTLGTRFFQRSLILYTNDRDERAVHADQIVLLFSTTLPYQVLSVSKLRSSPPASLRPLYVHRSALRTNRAHQLWFSQHHFWQLPSSKNNNAMTQQQQQQLNN